MTIEVKRTARGDIKIRIPASALRINVEMNEELPEGSRVKNVRTFSKHVLHALCREEEDGTTPVFELLDRVVYDAIENGAEGVKIGDEEDW